LFQFVSSQLAQKRPGIPIVGLQQFTDVDHIDPALVKAITGFRLRSIGDVIKFILKQDG
jgi:hypothetical protein